MSAIRHLALDCFRPETPEGVSWAWDVCRELAGGAGLGLMVAADTSDDEIGTTLFVASTDTPDRAMDVIKQDWNLKPFRLNPIILDNHDPRRIVGTAVRVEVPKEGKDAGKLLIEVKWDRKSPDPMLADVGRQHVEGVRRAGSVGFRPGKKTKRSDLPKSHPAFQEPIEVDTWWGGTEMVAGWFFEKCELFEFSSATLPMNPEAIQRSYLGGHGVKDPSEGELIELHALSLAEMYAAATPEERAAFVRALHADLLTEHRASPEYRRFVTACIELGPPPVSRSTTRGDGLDFLFHPPLET